MRLIPVKQATRLLKRMCTNRNKFKAMKLLTAKKDRSLTVKNDGTTLTMIEDGYSHINRDYQLADAAKCRHAVEAAFRHEFPRSNRAYLETVAK